jgi:hypothetical protein
MKILKYSKLQKIEWITGCLLPLVICAAFFYLNHYTTLAYDDFRYRHIVGVGTYDLVSEFPTIGEMKNVGDIALSMRNSYFETGLRVLPSILGPLFMMTDKTVFDICNTLIYIIFILLIAFHITGSFRKNNLTLFVIISLLLWFFTPAWGEDFLWLCGSCNYLWTTVLLLFFLVPFRKKIALDTYRLPIVFSILFFLLALLSGSCNENSGIAVLFLLFCYALYKLKKRKPFALFEILGMAGFLVGYIFLLTAPGNAVRMTGIILPPEPFYLRAYHQLLNINTLLYEKNLLYLPIATLIVTIFLKFVQKKSIPTSVWLFMAAGFVAAYAMVASPSLPGRTFLIVVVFFSISLTQSIMEIRFHQLAYRLKIPFLLLLFIPACLSFHKAATDVHKINQIWKERTQSIVAQKAAGIDDITIKWPMPAMNKHAMRSDISWNPKDWCNIYVAHYYGIASIRGVAE